MYTLLHVLPDVKGKQLNDKGSNRKIPFSEGSGRQRNQHKNVRVKVQNDMGTSTHICERGWEKGPYGAKNEIEI